MKLSFSGHLPMPRKMCILTLKNITNIIKYVILQWKLLNHYSPNRYEILKKKLAKEDLSFKMQQKEGKTAEKLAEEKKIEEAFLAEEQTVIQKEHSAQVHTKRLIDKMMFAEPDDLNNAICELLSNYSGILIGANA